MGVGVRFPEGHFMRRMFFDNWFKIAPCAWGAVNTMRTSLYRAYSIFSACHVGGGSYAVFSVALLIA